MRRVLMLFAVVACKGNSSTPVDSAASADAPPIIVDAAIEIDSGIDAPPPPACTGALCDPCTDPAQCMSMNC